MAVNTIQFGAPEYESPFTVSTGDVDVIKLRSRETAPLSHESLDENFTNLGNKINEILGIGIDALSITDGKIASANLDITNGTGLTYTSGVFAHQARPTAQTGYATADIDYSNRQYISALDFDSLGHVVGYKSSTLNFTGSNGITIDQDTNDEVSITTDAYRSGDSPDFNTLTLGYGIKWDDTRDNARIYFDENLFGANKDALVFEKKDINDATPDGGIAFANTGSDDVRKTSMVIRGDGNIGMGLTSPANKLEVKGTFGVGGIGTDTGLSDAIFMSSTSTSTYQHYITHSDDGLVFTNTSASSATRDYIFEDGGVVIRNDADAAQNSSNVSPKLKFTAKGWDSTVGSRSFSAAMVVSGDYQVTNGIGATKSRLHFQLESNEDDPEDHLTSAMVLTSDNKLGVGTTSPLSAVEIRTVGDTADDGLLVRSPSGGGRSVRLWVDGSTDTAHITAGTGLVPLILNGPGGNVGIGTTDPQAKLHIPQGETIGGDTLANSCLLVGSTSTGVGFDNNEIIKLGGQLVIGSDTNISMRAAGTERLNVHTTGASVTGKLSASSFFLTDSAFEMWHSQYLGVSNTSHPRVVQENGNNLEDGGVYRLTAHIHATSTHTGTRAVLWRGEDGLWMINQTTSSGGNSNHVEFYVDSTNIPRIRTWHASGYTVQVLHERIYLNQEGYANDRGVFGMDAMLSQIPEEQDALYFNRQQNKEGTVRGQKLIMDDGFNHVDIDGTLYVNNPYVANTENFSVKVSPTGHLSGQNGYKDAGGVGLFANANYAVSGNFNKMDTTIDSMAGISVKKEGEIEFYTASGLEEGDTTYALRNSCKMYIGSDGNVGIGTKIPNSYSTDARALELKDVSGSELILSNADEAIQANEHVGTLLFKSYDGSGVDGDEVTPHYAAIKAVALDGYGSMDLEFFSGERGRFESGVPHMMIRGGTGSDYATAGFVGIGTPNPHHKLHLRDGDLKISNDSGTDGDGQAAIHFSEDQTDKEHASIVYHGDDQSGGHNYLGIGCHVNLNTGANADDITLADRKNNMTLIVNSEGRVGVGTIDPGAKFHVDGSALGLTADSSTKHAIIGGDRHWLDFKETRIADAIDGNSWPNTSYRLQMRVDSTNHQAIDFVSDSNAREHIDIYTGNSVFHSRFTYDGELGIGTDNPVSELHIESVSPIITLKDDNNTGPVSTGIQMLDNDGNVHGWVGYQTDNSLTVSSASGEGIRFNVGEGDTVTRRASIDKNGQFRISTNGDLHVNTDRGNGFLQTSSYGVFGRESTNSALFINKTSTIANPDLNNTTGASNMINFRMEGTDVGLIYYDGTDISLNQVSDERLKENIQDSESGLSVISNISVRSFDWKEGAKKSKRFGFVAQELHQAFPEAVAEGGEDAVEEPWTVSETKLIPVLLKSIQEQQQVIEELKSRIETLESK